MKKKMKSKALAILMSLAMVFTMMPMMTGTVHAATQITVDGIKYILNDDNTAAVDSNQNIYITGIVTIPSTINADGVSYSVTSINEVAFDYCTGMTSIEIPSSVTSIGKGAFSRCSSLDSIDIPSSVTSIGEGAFVQCSSLESIDIPSSITSIGDGTFEDCSSLESITIPSSVTSIGADTFRGCSSLASITIPSSVTSIGGGAFEFCSSLESITIPSSVTSIGKMAFSDCSSLTSIDIPSSVTSIGKEAFYGCSSLTSINIDCNFDKALFDGTMVFPSETDDTFVIPLFESKPTTGSFEYTHTWSTEWSADGNNHWHECSICGAHKDEAAHSGGTATCKEKAKCETCNEEYGNFGQHKYGPWTKLDATQHQRVCEHDKSHVVKENHKWDSGKVTKKATEKATGTKTYTCTVCKATKTETIPKLKPTAPKTSGTPLAKATVKKKSMTIGWNKIQGAEGYDIFFATCNHSGKKIACKNVKTIKGNKTFKWTKSGLKKGTAYKFYVRAYITKNGKKTYINKSPMFHAYTGNGTKNYTNAKSVTVNKTKVTLKKGKTFKIKAKVNKVNKNKKLMPKSHAPTLRYMTSNKKVATVNSSGKITAKGKGTCYIYTFAHNGVSKQIKVIVK